MEKKLLDQSTITGSALFDAGAKPKQTYKGFSVHGNVYIPLGEHITKLPAGRYGFMYTNDGVYPFLKEPAMEDLIQLPDPVYKKVMDDLSSFWQKSDAYNKHGFIPRRGIMLYGTPGNGKSCLLQLVSDALITQYEGLIFDVYSDSDLGGFMSVMRAIREVEPSRKVVCMLEDMENLSYGGRSSSQLLNLLDGNAKINDITYIATTNYYNSLPDNLKNRPSRFNRKYELLPPNDDCRRAFLKGKFKELDDRIVDELVKTSKGYNIDTLKELVISTQVLGMSMMEAIKEIKGQFTLQQVSEPNKGKEDDIVADSIKEEKHLSESPTRVKVKKT